MWKIRIRKFNKIFNQKTGRKMNLRIVAINKIAREGYMSQNVAGDVFHSIAPMMDEIIDENDKIFKDVLSDVK